MNSALESLDRTLQPDSRAKPRALRVCTISPPKGFSVQRNSEYSEWIDHILFIPSILLPETESENRTGPKKHDYRPFRVFLLQKSPTKCASK